MTAAPKGLAKGTRIGEGINFQRWQVTKKLGEGGFAEVYEVLDSMTNEKVKVDLTGEQEVQIPGSYPHAIDRMEE